MKLSILIATVPERRSLLSRLLWAIEQQLTDEIEVLIYGGWGSFGDKVNQMREQAKGEYCVVVDDDDLLVSNYISKVLPHLDGLNYLDYGILYLVDGKYQEVIYSDLPHHKCIIRTDIARQVPLGNSYTADRSWSSQLLPHIRSKECIKEVLYIYDFYTNGSVGTEPGSTNVDNQRNVGEYPYTKEKFVWL